MKQEPKPDKRCDGCHEDSPDRLIQDFNAAREKVWMCVDPILCQRRAQVRKLGKWSPIWAA